MKELAYTFIKKVVAYLSENRFIEYRSRYQKSDFERKRITYQSFHKMNYIKRYISAYSIAISLYVFNIHSPRGSGWADWRVNDNLPCSSSSRRLLKAKQKKKHT